MLRFLAIFILTPLVLLGCAKGRIEAHKEGPHVVPGASAAEIQSLINENPVLKNSEATRLAQQEVALPLSMGARAYEWLKLINSDLTESDHFSFSNRDNLRSSPIERPEIYNAAIVVRKANLLVSSMADGEMKDVLLGNRPIPSTFPAGMSPTEFLTIGREVAHIYDLATRWVMMANFMDRLIIEQSSDVRGYNYFKNMEDVEGTLGNYKRLDVKQQEEIRTALIQLCMNDADFFDVSRDDCVMDIAKAVSKNKVLMKYREHRQAGERKFKNFFKLNSDLVRSDLTWDKKANVLHFPFLLPEDSKIAMYLKSNVEDEWKLPDWNLQIDFSPIRTKGMAVLEFVEGALAHVEPNKIVMDKNEPISEWTSQSTIRHEFGHLLGFKDCYVEFYDESEHAIVNYQLDTTDIMCSSAGRFKKSHYDRLKDAYKK
ncbi:MAG: hypothetical protein EOP05_04805 [Proteobacteria bacterium]|nr:MAG: hypothetical protein EOP05_04805 [Pseudomonadota bacterium]